MKTGLLLSTFFTVLFVNLSLAQIQPTNNASLHYRLIGFAVPEHKKATHYQLEIFDGSKQVLTKKNENSKIIAVVPSFGKSYTWQVKYYKKKRIISTTDKYKFTVLDNPFSNSTVSQVTVIDSIKKYDDLMVFFDNTRTLYNMKGEPLWFLPVIPGVSDSSQGIMRDIKLTSNGTITILTKKNVHEIDYHGSVLWSGPNDGSYSGGTDENYHHEFTKLANGHYMTISDKISMPSGTMNTNNNNDTSTKKDNHCGSVIEYNAKKEIVWSWNSCDYLHLGDLSTHFNSFHLDTINNVFYTSYRNISRIVKAAYPSGEVLGLYGENASNDNTISGHGMFYSQHNARVNSDGDFCLFNNNFIMHYPESQHNNKRITSIAVFKEPKIKKDTLEKIWEFACDIDTLAPHITAGGGSLYELDKGDYLVCMGRTNRNFIVSKDKKVLWNVLSIVHKPGLVSVDGYRVSPVFQKDLQSLLFR